MRGGTSSSILAPGFLAHGLPAHHRPGLCGHPHHRVALAHPHRLHSWHHPHPGLQGEEAHWALSIPPSRGPAASGPLPTSFLYLSVHLSEHCGRANAQGLPEGVNAPNVSGGEQVGWGRGTGEAGETGLCRLGRPGRPGALGV